MDQNTKILVEISEPAISTPEDPTLELLEPNTRSIAGRAKIIERVYEEFSAQEIEQTIRSIASVAISAVDKLHTQTCEVEFSLGFKAGLKIPVLASGDAKAGIKITLKWGSSPSRTQAPASSGED